MSKTKNYIEPADFFRETLVSIKSGEITDELARMFQSLASRYVNHPKFNRYFHLREDLIAAGVFACVRGYDKFRPDRNILTRDEDDNIIDKEIVEWDGEIVEYDYTIHYNPFAFFTTVVHNAIVQVLKNDYKQRNIVNAMRLENGLEADFGYTEMKREQEEAKREEEEEAEETKPENKTNGNIVW